MDAPGSLDVQFLITTSHLGSPTAYETKGIVIESPFLGNGGLWRAWQTGLSPSGDDREVPVSVATSGRFMRIELDLKGQDRLFGDGPFRPTVSVDGMMTTPPTRELIGGDLRFFQNQLCLWDTTSTLDRPVESTVTQAAPPTAGPNRGPSNTPPASQPQSPSSFPADGRSCPKRHGPTGAFTESASGNDHTSCEFAEEVRIAYADMGQPGSFQRLIVESPVTNTSIEMTCGPSAAGFIVCRGGDDAVVYLN
ncbi:hypothetical protein [Mycobacterium sp. E740]|uniref:hypothetical protein n=1 Tax=Mycobacterium sp. E740 TaxID=1834149 RepID=UPI001E5F7593|nr:hypothetical protein [Mycobacterium sp. E740]